MYAASRIGDDYESYISQLVKEWGYTQAEARKLSEDRRSWLAVPLFGAPDTVVAVIYMDSDVSGFFTDQVKGLVLDASKGIASYIRERYK